MDTIRVARQVENAISNYILKDQKITKNP